MSVLSGLTNQQANKNILLKTVRYENWITMSEKAGNVQRKTLKDLQKDRRIIAQDHLKLRLLGSSIVHYYRLVLIVNYK